MLLSHSIEIKPSKKCKEIFNKYFGYRRFCYNRALQLIDEWYIEYMKLKTMIDEGYDIDKKELKKYYPKFRYVRDYIKRNKYNYGYDWEDEYSQQVNDQAIEDLCIAFGRFIKGISNRPYLFRKRNSSTDSFRFQRRDKYDSNIRIRNGYLFLPRIQYPIKMMESPRYGGYVKRCTIIRHANKYFAVLEIEFEPKEYFPMEKLNIDRPSIGIDLGITTMITIGSYKNQNYIKLDNLYDKLKPYIEKLRVYDRIMNRKIYNSKNYLRTKTKLQIIHRKIYNIRNDYLHKLTTYLVKRFKYICIEDFSVKEWFRNLPRYSDKRRKLNFLALYRFKDMLQYKAPLYNSKIIIAEKGFKSTQICNQCGYELDKEERLYLKRKFKCPCCGNIEDRDVNSAYNLDIYARKLLGRNIMA